MIVVDTSALIDAFLRIECRIALSRLSLKNYMIAPNVLDIECLQALRRLELRGALTKDDAADIAQRMLKFPVERLDLRKLLPSVWLLRQNFSIYDALFVRLAQAKGANLLTHDKRMASAASSIVATLRLDEPAPTTSHSR